MALTITEKTHWKNRIESKLEQRIKQLRSANPELLESVSFAAREQVIASFDLGGDFRILGALDKKLREVEAERVRLIEDMHLKVFSEDDSGRYSLSRIHCEIADRQSEAAEQLLLEHELGKELARLTGEKERLSDSVLLANNLTEISEYLERAYALVSGEAPRVPHMETVAEPPLLMSEYSVQ